MSALQKKLLLLFALFLTAQMGVNLVNYFAEIKPGGNVGGDFLNFWRAAQHVRHGETGLIYNPDAWGRVVASPNPHDLTWFVYPPFLLFGLWPLGNIPAPEAALWWALAPLPFYFALAYLLTKRSLLATDEKSASPLQPFLITAACALPFLSANFFTGQTGALIAALMLAAAYCWRNRPLLAGICIGILAIKPQLGLLLPFALAASGQWRAIAAATATIIVLALAATWWLGVSIWTDYAQMTQLFGHFIGRGYTGIRQLALGPYVSLDGAGVPIVLAAIVQAIVSLSALAVVSFVFWEERHRNDNKLDLRLGLLATGALLATPYALTYDTPMLVLALIPLITRAWRTGFDGLELLAIVALLSAPYVQPLLMHSHIPFGFAALLFAFVVLFRCYQARPGEPLTGFELGLGGLLAQLKRNRPASTRA
jgi:hypothetical protein